MTDLTTIAREVSEIERIRAEPDYVPEFPPSRLIDDSPRGSVIAMHTLMQELKK